MLSETTWIVFCGPQHEVKASASSLALLLLRRWLEEEDAVKALSERKEVRINRARLKNKEMNSVLSPARLYRLEVRGKRGGETAQGSASLEALSVQQKIMVHFFLESDIFIGLLTGACDRLISNLSKVTVLGNCSTFLAFQQHADFLAFGFVRAQLWEDQAASHRSWNGDRYLAFTSTQVQHTSSKGLGNMEQFISEKFQRERKWTYLLASLLGASLHMAMYMWTFVA